MSKNKLGKKYLFLLLIALLVIFSWVYRETILIQAGRYLAPDGRGQADVIIISGNQFVKDKAARVGRELFVSRSGMKFVAVAIHKAEEDDMPFGMKAYESVVSTNLEALGIERGRYQIFATPNEHPITLKEADIVMKGLSGRKIRTALLLVEGFHMRRSYWVYRQFGEKHGIKIIPHPLFIKYHGQSWWKESWGFRDFVAEGGKFVYYVLRGYIPAKSLITAN